MSNYKPEILPSGVLFRKIKSEDNEFVISNSEQALIVTASDINQMHSIACPAQSIINSDVSDINVGDIKQCNTVGPYDAEVRRIAEVLHHKYWEYDGQSVPLFEDENSHPELWDQARAMVAEMAQSVKHVMKWFNTPVFTNSYLIKHGLIPSPENNNHE